MAVGVAIAGATDGVEYGGKITGMVLLSCVVAGSGGLIFGYDLGVTGGVSAMVPFLEKFFPSIFKQILGDKEASNYCLFDSQVLTLFTSTLYLSGLISSFFASPVTRKLGRKISILIGGFCFLIGAALCGAAVNIYMLIIGRAMLGVGIGFTSQSAPLYLSEMAPAKYRGALNSVFFLCIAIGVLASNVINYFTNSIKEGWGWRVSLAMAASPAVLIMIGGLFLTETPNNVIENGETRENATKLLQKIRGIEDVTAELEDIIAASQVSAAVKHPFKSIFQRKYRPQLVMAITMPFFLQFTGINVLGFYAPLLFRTFGSNVKAALFNSVIIGLGVILSSIASLLMVDRVGRRKLFLIGGIIMLICEMIVGSLMAAKLGDHGALSKPYSIALLVLICIFVAAFGLSWGVLGILIPSEVIPLEIRSAGLSIAASINLMMSFVIAQAFLAMLCKMKSGVFFFFGAWIAVMTAFVFFLLPETKGVPIEKMDKIWRRHWYWKKFVDENSH